MKMRRSETVRAWGIVCSHQPIPKINNLDQNNGDAGDIRRAGKVWLHAAMRPGFLVVIQASPRQGKYDFRKEQFGWSIVFMLLRPFLEAEESYEITPTSSRVLPARNLNGSRAGRGHFGRDHRDCNRLCRRCRAECYCQRRGYPDRSAAHGDDR